jgi:hypothetical protein
MGWKIIRATRPTVSQESVWLRSSKLHKGGVEGLLSYAFQLMYNAQFEQADAVLLQAHKKAPLDRRVELYRAKGRILQGELAPDVWCQYLRALESQPGSIHRRPPYPQPQWDGSPCPEQTILLWSIDAGLGDWIMLARLIPAMKAQSQAKVVLLLPRGLAKLLGGLADETYEGTLPPDVQIDLQIRLAWLPATVPLTDKILSGCPYLHAEGPVARWLPVFADRDLAHIGLQWMAAGSHPTGKARTIPLSALQEMFCIPHTRFCSLQYDGGKELKDYPEVVDLGNVDHPGERFIETAGILKCLDMVVCIDSSIGHLAGAMGIPTCVILGPMASVQWGLDDTTPWYPEHTLHRYRQRREGDWEELSWSLGVVLEGVVVRTLARSGIVSD